MRIVPVALFSLLAAAAPAFGDFSAHWLKVSSPHFTVISDGGERQARHTAGQLERMHDVFAKLLPHATDDPGAPIVVLALRDRKSFQSIEPAAYLQKNSLDLAGLFMSGSDRNYILLRLDSSGEHPYATVYHEYTHYLSRHSEYLPLWLNEGLAQFYQNTDIFDRDVRLGQPSVGDIQFLRQQTLLPLTTLFLVDHNSPFYHEENKGNVFYAESWALTHFLFTEDYGKKDPRLFTYGHYLAQGEGSVAAAQHAFGDLKLLQSQLQNYIVRGDYKEFTMPLQNAVDDKALNVEPLPTAEADAVRADVLARNGRSREAEALDKAILAEAQQTAQAHETLGLLELRAGDMEAARKSYGEAVALHSTSFLAFYNFGSLSMRDGRNAPESAADSLRQAITLNPRFAPALIALAQFDAMHDEKLDEALSMCLRAVNLEPRNIDYRLAAAEVRTARKEVPSAIAVLKAAAKIAQTPGDQARIQARLEQLENFQEQTDHLAALRTEGAAQMAANGTAPKPSGPATFTDKTGRALHPVKLEEPDHKFPDGPPSGPKHTVSGTLHSVGCFYPKGLTLQVQGAGAPVSLYSNDMYAISYTAGNFTPAKELNPCNEFDGMKAKVIYGTVDDPTVAGQILSMELNK